MNWARSFANYLITACIFSVPYRKCQNEQCEVIQPYDGCLKGILNMGDFLVGHDVLRDYMLHFLHGHRYLPASLQISYSSF